MIGIRFTIEGEVSSMKGDGAYDGHLYYPSRRQTTLAFAVLVDGLRYRAS